MVAETDKILKLPPVVVLGCGYLGSAVVGRFLARGASVTALTRNAAKAADLRAAGVRVVEATLDSPTWHSSMASAGAWVVNCVSAGGGGLAGYEQSYRRGMESLVAWARAGGRPAAVVYTSSTSVYAQDHDTVVDDGAPAEPTSEAGKILRAAEDLLLEAGSDVVGAACVLRLAGIYGPERHHLLNQVREGQGTVSGRPETWLNLIHRDDAASAIEACLLAAGQGAKGVFNVTDGAPARRATVVNWLAARLGLPDPVLTGEITAGRRQHTPNRRILASRLRQNLGWSPRYPDFRAGYTAILGA